LIDSQTKMTDMQTILKSKLITEMNVDELNALKQELLSEIRDTIDPTISHGIGVLLGDIDNQLKKLQ
jgi:hypothetical protein